MTLTEFLLARIAEDEAGATLWKTFEREWHPGDCTECGGDSGAGVPDFNSVRVLAECEAKRRIVDVFTWDDLPHEETSDPKKVLRHLATPYAYHPDYREEWKP